MKLWSLLRSRDVSNLDETQARVGLYPLAAVPKGHSDGIHVPAGIDQPMDIRTAAEASTGTGAGRAVSPPFPIVVSSLPLCHGLRGHVRGCPHSHRDRVVVILIDVPRETKVTHLAFH